MYDECVQDTEASQSNDDISSVTRRPLTAISISSIGLILSLRKYVIFCKRLETEYEYNEYSQYLRLVGKAVHRWVMLHSSGGATQRQFPFSIRFLNTENLQQFGNSWRWTITILRIPTTNCYLSIKWSRQSVPSNDKFHFPFISTTLLFGN